jgi:hypothetical protein
MIVFYERVKDLARPDAIKLILAIRRYFHSWSRSCVMGIRDAIEVSSMEQTAALSMTDHPSD